MVKGTRNMRRPVRRIDGKNWYMRSTHSNKKTLSKAKKVLKKEGHSVRTLKNPSKHGQKYLLYVQFSQRR